MGGERSATAVVWISERLHVSCAIFEGEKGRTTLCMALDRTEHRPEPVRLVGWL